MLCRGVGQADVSIASLEEAAALALARTEAERAVCIRGAITAICEGSDDGVPSADLLERDSVLSGAKAMLEEDEFIRAWRQGHAMSLEEAVAYAADEGTASAHFRPFLLK